MPTTNVQHHQRPEDKITIRAARSCGTDWVTLTVGDMSLTVFPNDRDAALLLGHLASEIEAARTAFKAYKDDES